MLNPSDIINKNKKNPFQQVEYSAEFNAPKVKQEKLVDLYINPHFYDYIFDWDHYYYIICGGYGSSKSYNTALKILQKITREKRTVLVARAVAETHKDSTFALFSDIINSNAAYKKMARINKNPISIHFTNGSKIIFKGMDNPEKLKSVHNVSIVWLEEATEISAEGFKEVVGRLRHPTQSLHIIITNNPVSKSSWVYKRFFINNDDIEKPIINLDDRELYEKRIIKKENTYYHHSVCTDNYFLPQSYIDQLDEMKKYDPDMYRIARQGKFGQTGLLVFPQFQVVPRKLMEDLIGNIPSRFKMDKYGMDFGFVESYNALIGLIVDTHKQDLYITSCYYARGKTDPETAREIADYMDVMIKADAAEPKTIRYYQQSGFNMRKTKKFNGSRAQYTKKIKRFRNIYCCADLKPVINELQELTYKKDKQGVMVEDQFNIDPHTLSAMWYALDDYDVPDLKRDIKKYVTKNRDDRSIALGYR